MGKEIRKIRTKGSKDDKLVEECKQETGCGDCEPITWLTPSKGTPISPPTHTVAVVVDVGINIGAVRIFEGEEYVNIVGMEEAGKRVIVPWDINWWFRASGSPRVGYIVEKKAT